MSHYAAAEAEIRALFEQIRSDWTAYTLQIELDNRDEINLAEQTDPFLCASIMYQGGEQLDLGAKPRTRQWGQIQLAVADKKGQGTGRITQLLDFVTPYFNMEDLATVRCFAAGIQKDRLEKEWYYRPVIIPFYYVWE